MKTTVEVATLELDKAKSIIDQFINSCSHNLKSPLTSIEGLVSIANYSMTREETRQCLDLIHNCASNMQEMIQKLEDYTVNLRREISEEEIVPDQLLTKIFEEYHDVIEANPISVSIKISEHMKWFGDRHLHYLILKNLIQNAIHFSDPDKKIKKLNVQVDVTRASVSIEISDNGIGISEAERRKLFKPFHRGSVQSKGGGLGLFLVKGLIDKIKATILIDSVDHVGTSIFLSIPNN
jgi:hypothetical protein